MKGPTESELVTLKGHIGFIDLLFQEHVSLTLNEKPITPIIYQDCTQVNYKRWRNNENKIFESKNAFTHGN